MILVGDWRRDPGRATPELRRLFDGFRGDTARLLCAEGGLGATKLGAAMLDLRDVLSRRGIAGREGVAAVGIDGFPLTVASLEGGLAVVSLSVAFAVNVTGLGVGSFEKRGRPLALTGLVIGSMLIVVWSSSRQNAHTLAVASILLM